MLETKIQDQPSAIAQGQIWARARSKSSFGKRSGSRLSSTVSMLALSSEPAKPQVVANDKDHSRLAMQAAKRMKSSKDKLRTGRLVCLHLRSLLTATQPAEARVSPTAYNPINREQAVPAAYVRMRSFGRKSLGNGFGMLLLAFGAHRPAFR